MYAILEGFTLALLAVGAFYLATMYAERWRNRHGTPQAPADPTLAERLADTNRRVEQLSLRLGDLAEQLAEDRLSILDTAEKVAARLSDRERKRRRVEEVPPEDHDEVPEPSILLARARAAYPLPGMNGVAADQLPLPWDRGGE